MKKMTNKIISFVEKIFGMPSFEWLSLCFAKIGLRGLGINIHYDIDRSGELWLLRQIVKISNSGIFIDVGANVGDFSKVLVELGCKQIYAFEPGPRACDLLKERFKSTIDVSIICKAVGERNDFVEFHVPKNSKNSTLSSRDIGITDLLDVEIEKIVVPMTCLDTEFSSRSEKINFLKIDVEGFELEVLRGASSIIHSENGPSVIQFEFNSHHRRRRQTIDDFSALLKNYSLYRLSSSSLRPIKVDHYLTTVYAYSNFVAIKNDALSSWGEVI